MTTPAFNPCDTVKAAIRADPASALLTARTLARTLLASSSPQDPIYADGACLVLAYAVSAAALATPEDCSLADVHATLRDPDRLLAFCAAVKDRLGVYEPGHQLNPLAADLIGISNWIEANAEAPTKMLLSMVNMATIATLPFAPSTRVAAITRATTIDTSSPGQIADFISALSQLDPEAVAVCAWAASALPKAPLPS